MNTDGSSPHRMLPDLMPIPAPALGRVVERDSGAGEAIKAEAERLRMPLADMLAALALEGWRGRCARRGETGAGPDL